MSFFKSRAKLIESAIAEQGSLFRLMKDEFAKNGGTFPDRIKGRCVMCPREFDVDSEFVDGPSLEEYKLSAMCQKCQDECMPPDGAE